MEIIIIVAVVVLGLILLVPRNNKKGTPSNEIPVETSKTGIYLIDGTKITSLNEFPEDGSINSIVKMLGYSKEQTHTVISGELKILNFIVIEKQSMKPLFFEMKDKNTTLFHSDVIREIKRVNWAFVKSSF